MMKNQITKLIRESIDIKQKVILSCLGDIQAITNLCFKTLKNGGKIIFCGNGGSAADSQHLSAEFLVRFKKDRKSLPAVTLTADTSVVTAIGNDYGFGFIFAKQLESMGNKNDILIAISTSGKSKNIIEAVKKAKQIGMQTIAFTGSKGKNFAKMCDLSFVVPSKDTARIQETHICIGHIVCELIEDRLF